MNPFSLVRALPQPLKTLMVLWVLGVLFGGLGVVLSLPQGVVLGPIGVIAVLTGLVLVTDLRGGATAYAEQMKRQRPLGVDYSRSWLATTAYARSFGAFATLAGAGMLFGSLTGR